MYVYINNARPRYKLNIEDGSPSSRKNLRYICHDYFNSLHIHASFARGKVSTRLSVTSSNLWR